MSSGYGSSLSRRSPSSVPAEVIPPDARVYAGTRAGDADRDRTLEHLTYMHANGHLDEETFNARRALAMQATSRLALSNLVTDLPAMPFVPPVYPPDPWWQRPRIRYPMHAAGAALGIITAITPAYIIHNIGGITKLVSPVVDVVSIVLGALLVLLNIIFSVDFADTMERRAKTRHQEDEQARENWRNQSERRG